MNITDCFNKIVEKPLTLPDKYIPGEHMHYTINFDGVYFKSKDGRKIQAEFFYLNKRTLQIVRKERFEVLSKSSQKNYIKCVMIIAQKDEWCVVENRRYIFDELIHYNF